MGESHPTSPIRSFVNQAAYGPEIREAKDTHADATLADFGRTEEGKPVWDK